MKIGIIGLGLIGGSLGRTIVNRTSDTVYAFDISKKAMLDGKLLSAYHKPLDKQDISELDVVFFSLYPDALEETLKEYCPKLKDGCLVCDCCGNKRRVTEQMKNYNHREFYHS